MWIKASVGAAGGTRAHLPKLKASHNAEQLSLATFGEWSRKCAA
eukprot:CAMPEP_0194491320 /NCGR_PEP_ID=MMETSP0253-20130528/10247_1 /TAXON_ID=2966 /ORGANISM="Noctiluca scintillans" /LENGTH=43 /DNA_ID= /DNA_START= /DNA_END= /DNA_ORIENTATION=